MNNVATTPSLQINRTRFLIIDDLAGRVDLAERYLLLGSALHVRKATSPLAGLRIMQDPRTPVDCVLCAQEFKPMSGLEFLQNLRGGRYGGPSISEIKFILMLRQRDDQVIQAATNLNVNGHIVGGFDRDKLTDLIVRSLKQPQATPNSANTSAGMLASEGAKGATIKIAHIRAQNVDLIIVPLEDSFGTKNPQEQQDTIDAIRESVARARLQGEVVPVWATGDGAMAFIAPKSFHPYFQSITLDFVRANLNRDLIVS